MPPSTSSRSSTTDLDLLNDQETADLLRISAQTIKNWRVLGLGPTYVRFGRSVRYRRQDLLRWIESRLVAPGGR